MTAGGEMTVAEAPDEKPAPNRRFFRREVIGAFERGRSPDFSIGDPSLWIRVLDELLIAGKTEIARNGLQHLCEQKPDLDWARSTLELVDAMPDATPGASAFVDDLRSDLQVIPRQETRTVVLYFCGRRNRPHMPLCMFQRWMAKLDASIVYLRDFDETHYLNGIPSCGSVAATVERLRRVIQELGSRRVLCLGNCSGGYGALRYGVLLGAQRVLAFGSPMNMEPEFNTYLNRTRSAQRLAAAFPAAVLDLREVCLGATHRPEARLFYGDKCWDDRIHSEHMAGIPGVTLQPVPDFDGHGIVPELIRRKLFDNVLGRFVASDEAE